MPARKSIAGDRLFALIVGALVISGLAMFVSAALGLLAAEDESPWRLLMTQVALGLIPGGIALATLRFLPLTALQKLALPLYILAALLTASVFIPGWGLTLNGATRWIDVGFTTIQPSEFLKVGVILMLAAYLAKMKGKLHDIRTGLIPFCLILGIPALVLLMQPNTSTVLILGATGLALYLLAGAPWRDIFLIVGVAVLGLALLVMARPYLLERVHTFIDPSRDPQGQGYQIQQSLIAIGSGGIAGRGFGQSAQKYNYLPEAQGDSVFAVFGEEFGFLGATIIIFLFMAFAARGFAIAAEAATSFGALAATGFTLLITLSAFLNIGAMLGILPLTGLPLPFVSHGGTALLSALAMVGIILNVAASRKRAR